MKKCINMTFLINFPFFDKILIRNAKVSNKCRIDRNICQNTHFLHFFVKFPIF